MYITITWTSRLQGNQSITVKHGTVTHVCTFSASKKADVCGGGGDIPLSSYSTEPSRRMKKPGDFDSVGPKLDAYKNLIT